MRKLQTLQTHIDVRLSRTFRTIPVGLERRASEMSEVYMSACVGHFQKVKRSTGSTARAINVPFLGTFFAKNLTPPTVLTGKP